MEFNDAWFDELGRSAGVRALVDEATERVAGAARKDGPEDSGEYVAGIVTAGKMQKRYVGLVIATARHSLIVESKTGNLARALRKSSRGR